MSTIAKDPRRNYKLRMAARKQLLAGKTLTEAARELGVGTEHLQKLLAKKRTYRPEDLDPDSFREYLLSLSEEEEDGTRTVGGERVISDADTRAYFRWVVEGCAPGFFAADRWLSRRNLHIEGFFSWCERNGRQPWATGVEPEWHRLEEG